MCMAHPVQIGIVATPLNRSGSARASAPGLADLGAPKAGTNLSSEAFGQHAYDSD